MNFFPSSPLRTNKGRFQAPRILDSREDIDHEDLHDDPNSYDDAITKAKEMENILSNAVDLAERDTGSILCFQNVSSKSSAVQLGRRVSTFRSMEDVALAGNLDEGSILSGAGSSFDGARSLPTFIRVEKGSNPILRQNSWESIWSSENDGVDNVPVRNPADGEAKVLTTRSWNKLRKSLGQEAAEAKNAVAAADPPSPDFELGGNVKKRRGLRKIKRDQANEKYGTGNIRRPTDAKDFPVELALHGKKKRWGLLRMGTKNASVQTSNEKVPASFQEDDTDHSHQEANTTQEISPDVSHTDETGFEGEVAELNLESVEIKFQRTKTRWGWWKNETEPVLATTCNENQKVECSEAELVALRSMSLQELQIHGNASNNGTDKLKASLVAQDMTLMKALGEWTGLATPPDEGKNKDVTAVEDDIPRPVDEDADLSQVNAMNLSLEEAQSMECVWLSGFL